MRYTSQLTDWQICLELTRDNQLTGGVAVICRFGRLVFNPVVIIRKCCCITRHHPRQLLTWKELTGWNIEAWADQVGLRCAARPVVSDVALVSGRVHVLVWQWSVGGRQGAGGVVWWCWWFTTQWYQQVRRLQVLRVQHALRVQHRFTIYKCIATVFLLLNASMFKLLTQ